jgi:uncharacterized protein
MPNPPANPSPALALRFLALTVAWTWVFWWLVVVLRQPISEPVAGVLFAVGGAGPMLVALGIVATRYDRVQRRDFFARIVDPRRIGPLWWPVILLLPALVTLLSIGIWHLLSGQVVVLDNPGRLLASPLALLWMAAFLFVFGPVPEEIGWRGLAQDRFGGGPARMLLTSGVIGVAWWLWHLPLFFMEGSYHADFGLLRGVLYLPSLLALSVIHTWIFFRTRRSTLGAILLHFSVNFTGEFIAGPAQAKPWATAIYGVLAAVIVVAWIRAARRGGHLA